MDTPTSSLILASDSSITSLPRTLSRLPAWARTVATMLAMFVAYAPALLLSAIPTVSQWLKSQDYLVNTMANLALYSSVALTMLLLASLLTISVDRRPASALGLRIDARGFASLILTTSCAMGIVALTTALLYGIGVVQAIAAHSHTPANAPIILILTMLIGQAFLLQGFGEEVLFRGYLMTSLSTHPQRGVWISAAAFTVLHLFSRGPQNTVFDRFLFLILPLGFAVLAGYLAILMRTTWAAVGIHTGMHLGSMTMTHYFGLDTATMLCTIVYGLVFLAIGLMVATRIPRPRWDEVAAAGPYAPPCQTPVRAAN